MDNLPSLDLEAFATKPSFEHHVAVCCLVFVVLWVVEFALRFTAGPALAKLVGIPELAGSKEKILVGRSLMSFIFMCWCTYDGIYGVYEVGGWEYMWDQVPVVGGNTTTPAQISAGRLYLYAPRAQRLALFHVTWEVKNLMDSIIHGDGIIFVVHHILTGVVAYLGLNPFMQIYAPFFLGVTELSTAVLCVLALFDDERGMGIPALAVGLPGVKARLGEVFAVSFVALRIVAWPLVSYVFIKDTLAVMDTELCHSYEAAVFYLVSNVVLTTMQFIWLGEIIQAALKQFGLIDDGKAKKA